MQSVSGVLIECASWLEWGERCVVEHGRQIPYRILSEKLVGVHMRTT